MNHIQSKKGIPCESEIHAVGIRSGLGRFTRSNPGIRIYTREVNRLRAEATATLDGTRQRLTTLNRQIANIVDTVAAGRASPALLDSLEKLETEKNHLERDLRWPRKIGQVFKVYSPD